MAHEQSITITREGKHYNIPSVVEGEKVSNKEAEDYAVKTKNLGKAYKDIPTAVEAAKKRSASFDWEDVEPEQASNEQGWEDVTDERPIQASAEEGWTDVGVEEQPQVPVDEPEPYPVDIDVEDPTPAIRGLGEVALQMGTGFAAAVPATAAGAIDAIKSGDPNSFVNTFMEIQEALTYIPRTEKGTEYAQNLQEFVHMYSEKVDEYLVEPNLEQGNVLMATVGKTAGEAMLLLAPLARVGKKGPAAPVSARVTAEKAISGKAEPKPEAPLEGELMPREEILTKEEVDTLMRHEEPVGRQIEGEWSEFGGELEAPQRALEGPRPEADVVPIEEAALKRTVKDIEVREIEPEIIEVSDPYVEGGPLAGAKIIDFSKMHPKQRGMIDPGVFAEGIKKLYKMIDQAEITNRIREKTQPLQAGSPEFSGIIKNYANNREVIREQQRQLNKELATFSKGERDVMLRSLEHPERRMELTPRQRELVEEMNKDMDTLGEIAVQMGILSNVRKNYAKHVVIDYLKDPAKAKRMFGEQYFKTWIKTGKRKYETLEEGEAAGIEYLTDFSVMSAARAELANTVYTKQFVNWVKNQDLGGGHRAIGIAGENVPGYVTINHPAFRETVFKYERTVTKDGKKHFVNKETNSVEIKGKTYPVNRGKVYIDGRIHKVDKGVKTLHKNIMVHPDLARPLKNLIESEDPNILLQGFLGAKANAMKVIMYNPAFHGMTVLFKQWPTLPVSQWHNPLKYYVEGYRLNKVAENRTDAIQHNVRFLGGRGYKQDIYGEIEVLRDNILHKVDPKLGNAFDKAGHFWHGTLLWDRIGDLQMGMYDHFWKKNYVRDVKKFKKETGKKPNAEEAARIKEDAKYTAGEFSNLIAGAFGREDFGIGWRNFLNSVLFSRSYTMSNLRLAKYGVGVMPKHLIGQMKATRGLDKADAARAFTGLAVATLFKDLFLFFGTLHGFNYALTKMNDIPDKNGNIGGHYGWDNEPGKEWKIAMDVKENGQVVYMGSPFRAARDILEIGVQPRMLLANKRNPVFTTVTQWVENRNWKGKTILKDGDDWYEHIAETSKHLAKGLTGFDTMYSTFSPDDESWRNRYRFLGLQVSHGAPGGMRAGNIRQIQREQQQEKDIILAQATEHIKRGREDEAITLMIDNSFTKGEIEGFINRSTDPYATMLKNLDLKGMYRRATPEQRKRLDEIKF